MRILVTGVTGQLGRALCDALSAAQLDGIDLIAADRRLLDLSAPESAAAAIDRWAPDLVLNAAADTAVDQAEERPELAFRINADAPAAIARACARRGAAIVHFSTDYVFDGTKADRYVEIDTPNPLNAYGRSKLAGERAVLEAGCAAIVLRTSWVYGEHGANFLKTMLRLACERDALRVISDQHGAPTRTSRLAEAVLQILAEAREAGCAQRAVGQAAALDWLGARSGLYHLTASGRTTWFDYARTVIAAAWQHPPMQAQLRTGVLSIEPIQTSTYPTPARRPANSLLDCSRFERTFGYVMPHWHDDVIDCVRRVLAPA